MTNMGNRQRGALTLCLLAIGLIVLGNTNRALARWEITAFRGYGIGGKFEEEGSGEALDLSDKATYGLSLNVAAADTPDSQYELYLSHQATRLTGDHPTFASSIFDVDVTYYHLGGLIQGGGEHLKPFVVGTLGATHLDPDSRQYDDLWRPSLGLGGGVKLFPVPQVGIRLEVRGMVTFTNGRVAFTSDSNGATIYVESDAFFQCQFNAGVTIVF